MGLIDTHTHLDGFTTAGCLTDVLSRARAAGVAGMIAIGTEPSDWPLYRECAAAHPGFIWHTAGLHPCSVGADWPAALEQLAQHGAGAGPAPVALGECGLDRFHLPKDPAAAAERFAWQRAAFAAQLALAQTWRCPVVIHSRGAFAECVEEISASGLDWGRVVFHCFSEGPAEMAQLNALGGRGSFTGILTYKNAESVRAAARVQGIDRLMVETDAPFLAPVPHRGKPNEPAYVRFTAAAAAALFHVSEEDFAARTTANARAFFEL